MKGKILDYKRSLITDLLKHFTEEQQKLFTRIYGKVDLIEESKLDPALSIIERTLNKFGEKNE